MWIVKTGCEYQKKKKNRKKSVIKKKICVHADNFFIQLKSRVELWREKMITISRMNSGLVVLLDCTL